MRYAAKKIAAMLLTMVIVSLLAFTAFSLISGDAAEIMLGTQATPERLAALRAELGLDRPLPARYVSWLLGFFTGDLGVSIQYKQPVWDLIAPKVLVTLCLSLLCFLLITIVSIPLGLWSASRSGGALDGLGTVVNQLCMAVPSFFTGILLSWGFGIVLKWFMPGSFPALGADFPGAVKYLFFAAAAIAVPRIAMAVRMLRGTILTEMRRDYVRTAISRGAARRRVLYRHVLKNSWLPWSPFWLRPWRRLWPPALWWSRSSSSPAWGGCWWPPSPIGTIRWCRPLW